MSSESKTQNTVSVEVCDKDTLLRDRIKLITCFLNFSFTSSFSLIKDSYGVVLH